ncbi:uncharacterized protein C8R40DRAFT_1068867 [Lentinula edodes]|uniref:uncharacterized protein n=1 Tax=Lentinula edodes TaxID=5353 RepID=UPI001E8D5770|nr:uncharacterized protein C8R40DRAFT_1068867 [Lentinula edodes]KAH7876063.1 hypothetical protein C8R40DRAFT_1068867 [Lentinula edodes]
MAFEVKKIERTECLEAFIANNCNNPVPFAREECMRIDLCLKKSINNVGYGRLAVGSLAHTLNGFFEEASLKTLIASVMILLILAVTRSKARHCNEVGRDKATSRHTCSSQIVREYEESSESMTGYRLGEGEYPSNSSSKSSSPSSSPSPAFGSSSGSGMANDIVKKRIDFAMGTRDDTGWSARR